MSHFKRETIVHLRDTDATGRFYFPRAFELAVETFELYLAHCGLPLGEWLRAGTHSLPVVHASADYLKPMWPGHALHIALTIEEAGTTSLPCRYEITDQAGDALVRLRLVHVMIDPRSGEKKPIPTDWLHRLTRINAG